MPQSFLRPDCILAAFGAILLGLGLFTWWDKGRRADLEATVLASAVGDDHHFVPADGASPGTEAARGDGGPWVVAEASSRDFPEADLRPEAMAEVSGEGYVLYRNPKAAADSPAARFRYLKTGPGRFLAVESAAAEPPPR